MAASVRFWDRIADKYSRDPIADDAAYQRKLEVTRALFRPDMDVLEIGCGTGSTALLHAPHVRSITALDFSERMLEIARDKAAAAGVDNISFEWGDAAALDQPEGRYDMVMAMSVLHLLADPDATIRKAHATLKPGGYFVTSTACLGDWMAWMRFVAPLGKPFGLLPELNVMTARDLLGKLESAGFSIVHRWEPNRKAAVFLIGRKSWTGSLELS